jgi:hypothetical protein
MPDWNSGEWAQIGVFDVTDRETYERCPCDPYVEELRRWQKLLHQPEHVDPNTFDRHSHVQLAEIRRYAKEWEERTPGEQRVTETVPQAA